MLLLALLGGIGIYAATGDKSLGILAGGGTALIALLVLYQQGKADRAQLEQELSQMDEEEQAIWREIIDNPDLLEIKAKELFAA